MTKIGALLYTIEDPINMIPLVSVCRELGSGVTFARDRMMERSSWWGNSPKHLTVEDEHDFEVADLFVSSAFVLAQASITQTVSIVRKIRVLAGEPVSIPHDKSTIMSLEASIHSSTRQSRIVLIDAVANYVKHHYEWPDDWNLATKRQKQTIAGVSTLGLTSISDGNLTNALSSLDLKANNLEPLALEILEWRERLSQYLRHCLGKLGMG